MASLFRFRGTLRRSRYWLVILIGAVASILFSLPINWLPVGAVLDVYFLGFLILAFGYCWVFLALSARRLRDAGLSPWLCLLLFVPLANLVMFLIIGIRPTVAGRRDLRQT